MSKKMQLPDEMLDLIAGGKIVIEGQVVTDLKCDLEGATATTAQGTYSFKWNKDADFSEEFRTKWLPEMQAKDEHFDMTKIFT